MIRFLIVLAVSIVASIELWNFGVAAKIWPSHPLLCTTVLAMALAIAVQMSLGKAQKSKSKSDASQ
jgi:hypothetical protein